MFGLNLRKTIPLPQPQIGHGLLHVSGKIWYSPKVQVKKIMNITVYLQPIFLYRAELYYDVPRDEAENWIRLAFLLINKGTPCVRNIIRDWLEEKNLTLDILLNHNKRNFTERAPMFESDKILLYPPAGKRPEDLLEQLNLTVLILLIGHCKIFQMGPPNGWKKEPDSDHTDSASDIVRLRMIRNELYHSPLCAIANEEFKEKWTTLTDVLIRLGAVDHSIQDMKTCHFSQLRAQRTAYAKTIRELFGRDKYFVKKFIENSSERLQKKEKLDDWLNAKDQGLRQKVAIEAMGYQSGYQSGYSRAKAQKIEQQNIMRQPRHSTGENVMCSKCNRQYSNICSDCTTGYHSGSEPELSMEDKICTECNKPIGNTCSDCSSRQSISESDLNVEKKVICPESSTSTSTVCRYSSRHQYEVFV